MNWIARQATPAVAPTVREIARESWHAAYDEFLGASQVTTMVDEWYALETLEESIADASEREEVSFLVAVPDGGDAVTDSDRGDETAVGFAHAGTLPDDPSTAYLSRLYARPAVWGGGVGTTLLARVEADVRPRCDRLRLTVLADNEIGVSFYESAGFERMETQVSALEGTNDAGDGELEEYSYEKPL